MSSIYFSGLNGSSLIFGDEIGEKGTIQVSSQFAPLLHKDITDIEIGWDYLLIWKNDELYLSGKLLPDYKCKKSDDQFGQLLKVPEGTNLKFKQAIAGMDYVTILTESHDIWTYNFYDNIWKKVPNFISVNDEDNEEHAVKIAQGRCTVALTNHGHVYNIPIMLNNPDTVKFTDVACGYDHTILLSSTGDVYSTGMGTRGQLGHGDLEDCDEPKLIEALAGLKVVQISAGGWHSAAITNQGDVYTWGWNNQGQLGLPNVENVSAVPSLIDFMIEKQETVELNIIKAQCGSAFTICQTDAGDLWGCGSNKYGQLGQSREDQPSFKQFEKLNLHSIKRPIVDFKCHEWGTCIYTK